MLSVKTPDEAFAIIETQFDTPLPGETVPLAEARGRVLSEDIVAGEYIPGFHRSTVDGWAVMAAETFGCSDSMPAIFVKGGAVAMGEAPPHALLPGTCMEIPTGGQLPEGADAVAMLEYSEDYGDGAIGICKPIAPKTNIIFQGDDVFPGKSVLLAGRRLTFQDVGALAAMGITAVPVRKQPRVAIISTGDELVAPHQVPGPGQIRDVNTAMLAAFVAQLGGVPLCQGFLKDQEKRLRAAVEAVIPTCDMVMLSGGSSVGEKDAAHRVIASLGRLLFHGIAMKPGKPTMLGIIAGKPILGLPGHPAAAAFTADLFGRAILEGLTGSRSERYPVQAVLDETIGANHGRAEYMGVKLYPVGTILYAHPIRSKSGLITALAGSDGWFCIPRDVEGLQAGATIQVMTHTIG